MILPVSSLITGNPAEQRSYDQLLDTVSGPLMRALVGTYAFAPAQKTYPDGIRSNFEFQGDAIAKPVWRYLADLLARTIREEMHEQSHYLRRHGQARGAIKDIVEMPDIQADRIIRSVEENKGKLSNVLAKELPLLAITLRQN